MIGIRNTTVANTGAAQGTGDVGITTNVPAETVDGDVMYYGIHGASSTGVYVTPAGWDVVEAMFNSTGQASSKMALYRKVASSEPASHTITWGAAGSTGRIAAIMVSLFGVNTVTPQQDEAKDPGAGPTSTEVLPSVTPTIDTMILGFVGSYTPSFSAVTWTPDAAMIEQTETSSFHASASNASMQLSTQLVSAGATGTRTATGSLADLRPCGIMVALNPAVIIPVTIPPITAPVTAGRGWGRTR